MPPRPTALLVSAFILVTTGAVAGEAVPDENGIMKPEDVEAGMKGYALTVIRGTEPERFDVEVLGRLEDVMPGQDMILVKCDDDKIERTGVASGMSGSPVFVEGRDGQTRLMGALAYSWAFQNEPIAGVTPITNMLADFRSKDEVASGLPQGDSSCDVDALLARLSSPSAPAPKIEAAPGQLRPVATPLIVSGVPTRLMGRLKEALSPLGLEPVQGGSGAGGEADRRPFRPGDAIGVQLMRGDANWTAIGTVTHVDGPHVLAFGHPFLQAGPWHAPVTRARVEWILSRNSTSFKLASPTGTVGTLVDDLRSCIVAKLGPAPEMVPLKVEVSGRGRSARTFEYEIVQHPSITGLLAFFAATDSIETAYPWRDDATIRAVSSVDIEGHGTLEMDTIESMSSASSLAMGRALGAVVANPFKRVKVLGMRLKVSVEPGRKTASILSVKSPTMQVEAGAVAELRVRVRPYGADDEEITVKVPVDEEYKGKKMRVRIASAGKISPDVAPPRDFDDYLRIVEAVFEYPETSMAAVIEAPTRGLRSEGRVMPALPSSVMNVLVPAGSSGPSPSRDSRHILFETRWVLFGSAEVVLDVKE